MNLQLPLNNQIFRSDAMRVFADAIAGNHTDYINWICENHIGMRAAMDIYYNDNEINIRAISPDVYGIPFLKCNRLARQVMLGAPKELWLDFLCQALKNGFYIIAECDEYYIPERWCTGLSNFNHSELIHGFDRVTQMFLVYGFTKNRRFESVWVLFDDVVKSIERLCPEEGTRFEEDKNNLLLVSVDQNVRYDRSLPKITRCISQYLDSKNLLRDLALYFCSDGNTFNASWLDKYYRVYSKENIVYGMKCYDVFADWFVRNREKNIRLKNPANSLYAIKEHKRCMHIRLDVIANCATQDREALVGLSDRYQKEVYRGSDVLLNLWLKYEVTEKESDIAKLPGLIMNIKKKEYEILREFVALLKQDLILCGREKLNPQIE